MANPKGSELKGSHPQVAFDSFVAHQLHQDQTQQVEQIRPAKQISTEIEWPTDNAFAAPAVLVPEITIDPRRNPLSNKWLWLTITVFGLAGIELVLFVDTLFSQQDWLSAAWLVVIVGILMMACKQLRLEATATWHFLQKKLGTFQGRFRAFQSYPTRIRT